MCRLFPIFTSAMKRFLSLFLGCLLFAPLSAQVNDDFSDGDFTSSPSWSGDGTEFMVNASQQLQLNNTVAGASYLSTGSPTASLDNIQWNFYIKQAFAPSGSNYGRVYLASDQANLEGALNGYYLQFGEAGSLDAVELFRQTGLTSTSVCRGTNAEIAASFAIGVKVTRDASGNWSLFVDPAGGTAYSLEATGTDLTYTTTAFFGVATVYTLSNATKFYFDDFYDGALIVDTTPPALVSASPVSATAVDVLFDEALDLTTSQTLTNYSADNGLGSPASAVRDGSNPALIHLTFATSFTSALLNTLTVTNVQDQSGNPIGSANIGFTWYATASASFKDVLINEIMADETPQVGLPAFEFVELYNRSSASLNLNGWTFTDGSSTATLGNYNLGPAQYLIICPVADTASFSPYGTTMGVSSFPSLNNSGDNLKLKDNTAVVIDSVDYSDAWYQDAVKKNGGWTLELINPFAPIACPVSNNWIASTAAAGGTPGIQNSVYSTASDVISPAFFSVTALDSTHVAVCFSEAIDPVQLAVATNYAIDNGIGVPISAVPNGLYTCVTLTVATMTSGTNYQLSTTGLGDCSGNPLTPVTANFGYYKVKNNDIVINEIMADPDPVVTILPNNEYVELYNRTAFAVDLSGWEFSAGTTTKTISSGILPANGYAVLTSTTAAGLFPSGINVVGVTSFPSLTNTGQTITIKNPQGNTINSVTYSDSWYQDAAKKDGGFSLEMIDANNPCAGSSNWRASNATDGGTPGLLNSIAGNNPDLVSPEVFRAAVVALDTIQVYFNEPIDSTTYMSPLKYTIDNGVGFPLSVQAVAPDFKSVRLALASALTNGVIYTVTVDNAITDCAGNAVNSNNQARFAIPEPVAANDLVINEILFDPNTGGNDFVEIYNRSNKVIDLKTIAISQYDTVLNQPINLEDICSDGYLIFPEDYLVLSKSGSIVKSQYFTENPKAFLDVAVLPTMNIDKGTVCLSAGSLIVDNFRYYQDMQFPLLNVTKGVSLERIDFNRPTQDRSNWHSAAQTVGYATPGYKNSQYSDAGVTDNTIEITPELFSPDEDGHDDVVNINYKLDEPGYVANITVYDSKGRLERYLVRNELLGISGTFSWDGINEEKEKSRVGIYILFIEFIDLNGTVKHYKKTCVLATKF